MGFPSPITIINTIQQLIFGFSLSVSQPLLCGCLGETGGFFSVLLYTTHTLQSNHTV